MESYVTLKLCRNLQALAAYAFLCGVKGKRHFLSYILPAWVCLNRTLSGPMGRRFPALADCVRPVGLDSLMKRVETMRLLQVSGDNTGLN
jgi:hypothetical protein